MANLRRKVRSDWVGKKVAPSKPKRDWEGLIRETQRSPNISAREKQRRIQGLRREMTMERQRQEAGGVAQTRPKPKARPRSVQGERKRRRTSTWGIDETMKKLGIY